MPMVNLAFFFFFGAFLFSYHIQRGDTVNDKYLGVIF